MSQAIEIFMVIMLALAVILSFGTYAAYFLGTEHFFKDESINSALTTFGSSRVLYGFIAAIWTAIILYEILYQIQVQTLF